MSQFPTEQQIAVFASNLTKEQPVPTKNSAEALLVSYTRVFRRSEDALEFAQNILLGDGESLIGGQSEDSVGPLWWAGIQVDKFERWRAKGGFHHAASLDPESPENEML